MLGKHGNVFADVSGLLGRPWQAYGRWSAQFQSGVIEKLLFGSDFPYTNAADCIETLYSLNQIAQGTNLPVVPESSAQESSNVIRWGCSDLNRVRARRASSKVQQQFQTPKFGSRHSVGSRTTIAI